MIVTEVIFEASELQVISDSMNRIVNLPDYYNGRVLSPEGQKLKEIIDNLKELHSDSSYYVIRRLEAKG